MTRFQTLCLALLTATLFATGATPSISQVTRHVGPAKMPSCRYRYMDGNVAFSQDEIRHTIRCAVARWPVPGGVDYAFAVARRESGFQALSQNPSSSASGVYQFVNGTWASQIQARGEFIHRQEVERSVWNGRSNVLIAIKLVHGCRCWQPWGG
jgi:hypothetical protein